MSSGQPQQAIVNGMEPSLALRWTRNMDVAQVPQEWRGACCPPAALDRTIDTIVRGDAPALIGLMMSGEVGASVLLTLISDA